MINIIPVVSRKFFERHTILATNQKFIKSFFFKSLFIFQIGMKHFKSCKYFKRYTL